jgi:hypothetical protein
MMACRLDTGPLAAFFDRRDARSVNNLLEFRRITGLNPAGLQCRWAFSPERRLGLGKAWQRMDYPTSLASSLPFGAAPTRSPAWRFVRHSANESFLGV